MTSSCVIATSHLIGILTPPNLSKSLTLFLGRVAGIRIRPLTKVAIKTKPAMQKLSSNLMSLQTQSQAACDCSAPRNTEMKILFISLYLFKLLYQRIQITQLRLGAVILSHSMCIYGLKMFFSCSSCCFCQT